MRVLCAIAVLSMGLLVLPGAHAQPQTSPATEECLGCHSTLHPGIVSSWQKSRHAAATPLEASKVEGPGRKVSLGSIPDELKTVVVGCAECHTMEPKAHGDSFDHNGHPVHVVVSPGDCRSCHKDEAAQYDKNPMSQAYGNLMENSLYRQLIDSIDAAPPAIGSGPPIRSDLTDADSCLYCHGTKMTVSGMQTRETEMGGMDFPVMTGWPNQGVGRINPDGSKGSCTPCHNRHEFSMETARKPYTCKECHAGPDVPAFKVYDTSKHGNIFSAHQKEWDFKSAAWTVGKDFNAPTCAACHMSLLVNADGRVIANRTHEMKDRLPWRIFGLIYAHPQPRGADTSVIRNADGIPLPTDFRGGTAGKFLITKEEMAAAQKKMESVCLSCHAQSWVDGYWGRFINTIEATNACTFSATQVLLDVWKRGLAAGLEKGGNPFDESIEKMWTDIWLFYANTVRFSSAMGGGGDYGVFADGRYQLKRSLQQMREWAAARQNVASGKPAKPKAP